MKAGVSAAIVAVFLSISGASWWEAIIAGILTACGVAWAEWSLR
jgi:hypothetical protein